MIELTLDNVKSLILEIEEQVRPSSNYYGRLLRWRNYNDETLDWNYGIGLSRKHLFDTQSLQVIERHQFDIMLDPYNDPPSSTDDVIERLKYSLRALFESPDFARAYWKEDASRGEQLAQLIVNAHTISPLNDIQSLQHNLEDCYTKYLNKNAPDLNYEDKPLFNILTFNTPKKWVYIICCVVSLFFFASPKISSAHLGKQVKWQNRRKPFS